MPDSPIIRTMLRESSVQQENESFLYFSIAMEAEIISFFPISIPFPAYITLVIISENLVFSSYSHAAKDSVVLHLNKSIHVLNLKVPIKSMKRHNTVNMDFKYGEDKQRSLCFLFINSVIIIIRIIRPHSA